MNLNSFLQFTKIKVYSHIIIIQKLEGTINARLL